MRVKTATEGKTKDVAIVDVTPDNYIVPENEKHLYHVVQEVRKFNTEDGKRMSIPRIQKYGKKGWETGIETNLKKQGYTITMLHDPNEWIKSQSDKKAKSAEQKAKVTEQSKVDAAAKAADEQQKAIDYAVSKALTAQSELTQKAIDKAVADALAKQSKNDTNTDTNTKTEHLKADTDAKATGGK